MVGRRSEFPVGAKAREQAAERQFIDYTKLQAEHEMIHASQRFIDQFSKNPFAGTKMKGHTPLNLTDNVSEGSLSPGTKPALTLQMASEDQAGPAAEVVYGAVTDDGTSKTMEDQVADPIVASVASSHSDTPIKITTKKSSFKFNPLAKEFVPDPNLIITPYGIIPKEKPLLPHQQATFHPYDQRMSEGYRAYADILKYEFHNRNTDGPRWH